MRNSNPVENINDYTLDELRSAYKRLALVYRFECEEYEKTIDELKEEVDRLTDSMDKQERSLLEYISNQDRLIESLKRGCGND